VYEKCRVYSAAKCSHHSKLLALCHVLNKLSKNMILNCDFNNRFSELSYVLDQSVANEEPLQPIQLLLRVCGDKASVTQPVVRLPSASGSGTDVEDDLEAGPILFMLPGLEGMASVLEPLARNLNYQTVCLQLGYNQLGQTIQDMAQALLPVQFTS